jgi:holo-[acyl-carrier protein] synthase
MQQSNGVRVGLDLTLVADVADAVTRFGARYVERIYTEHERTSCVGEPDVVAAGLAARFAAKEAAIKVLRPRQDPPAWRDIEVRRQPGGACSLRFTGRAAELADAAGIEATSLSMTHEAGLAAAVVVACTDGREEDAA